jgi:dTMP kinase
MKNKIKTKGKIIVIDGIDGSGKTTQVEILMKRLKKEKKNVVYVQFAQYEKNFFGQNIYEFLHDPKYNFLKVHAKLASLYYAADRWESKQMLEKYLTQGKTIIMGRYVSSNQIHQGGKIKDVEERKEFMKWLDKLEYKVFKIPRPSLVVYLSLELKTSQKLAQGRGGSSLEDFDFEYQKNSRESAMKLATELKNMKVVNCDDGKGDIKSREEIHEDIYKTIKKYL